MVTKILMYACFDGIFEDGMWGYSSFGDLHVVDVRLERLYETANPANFIFNPTPKDDYTDKPVREEVIENGLLRTYGTPRNNLYVVANASTNCLRVASRMIVVPSNSVEHVYCGAFCDGIAKTVCTLDMNGVAHLTIPIDEGAVVTNLQIRVGLDLNCDETLSYDESTPLEVYRYNDDARCANVVGVSKEAVAGAEEYIYTKVGGWQSFAVSTLLPTARNLLSVFYSGATSLISPSERPVMTDDVVLDAGANFTGYSEWLTHAAGASFDASGVTTIKEYTWNESSALALKLSECTPFAPWNMMKTVDMAGGIVVYPLTDTGRTIIDIYNAQLKNRAESLLQNQPDWSVVVFSETNGWSDAELVSNVLSNMSPSYVDGKTVCVGTLGGYDSVLAAVAAATMQSFATAGDQLKDVDAFLAIGRGRVINPSYWISARKTPHLIGDPTCELYQIGFSCTVGDLYDFNFEDGDLSRKAAIIQLGYGKGDSGHGHGRIYRHKVLIDRVYTNPNAN